MIARTAMRFVALAFPLHWIWETLHAPAYVQTSGPLLWRAVHCLPMAVVDVGWTAAVCTAARLVSTASGRTRARTTALLLAAGFGGLLGVAIEKFAIATDRWTYTSAMPLIPGLHVGLWPVLQMSVIPPIVWLAVQTDCRRPKRQRVIEKT